MQCVCDLQSNVEVRYILARGERHISLYAQRDIAANEELFFDYNYTNESHQLHSPTVVAGKAMVKGATGKNAGKLLPATDTRH